MNNKLNLHKYITVLRDTNCSERNSVIQLINNCIILMKALTFFFSKRLCSNKVSNFNRN